MKNLKTPLIVDVEASGFGPFSYPIEVGLALDQGQKYCSLVIPAPDWTHWDEQAESVHHVSRDILREYGKPIEAVAKELNRLLQNKIVYTDGWVVDKPWLDKLFYESRIRPEFTVSCLEMILSEEQMEIWHATKDRIEEEMDVQRHRASNDAYLIQKTWLKTRNGKA
ncbi:hypothetical protein [Magnetofaba australis]|nr:hypothetical protein [Magnetofaba australis]